MIATALIPCLCCVLAWGSRSVRGDEQAAVLSVSATVLDGSNPGIRVTGLKPSEVVRVHVLRSLERWKQEGGEWRPARQTLHAYADFAADSGGVVHVDSQTPIQGTYTRADPLALLRTGYRRGDPALNGLRTFPNEALQAGPQSRVWIKLERDGELVADSPFDLIDIANDVKVTQKFGNGWHAVYARPDAGKNLPAVISLHGSEGGSVEKARGRAVQLASSGFAAVGVNYFASQREAIKGGPTQHTEIKIEILASIRDWLKTLPGWTRTASA